ncbi:hypothetical protein [Mycolicibacterium sp. YH-1]|uniref:hypothetical protein n=1 Tax=Mycolicibacterium sp. YH-1 TaxID=2908837 RepID=UPI001F4C1982|nr:hypothetical protein [Mycolicibacterium sp. YH-1]UNB49937.1 hypothetical protein L0M16_18160 [Mycolicibacterium sp. YH-1]
MRPRIVQTDDQIGFYWVNAAGAPCTLQDLVLGDDEPDRLVATHLEALDDALIIAAARFGELLGGGKQPTTQERDDLAVLYQCLDRLVYEYASSTEVCGVVPDVRAGKIIGTAALFSICARSPLDLLGPAPLDGELDEAPIGVVSGFGEMQLVDPGMPWKGGRWILKSESGQRYPLTLATMLFDSSGVNKDAARREHRDVIESCAHSLTLTEADPLTVACALDWLLYDWLMAHREDPESAAITFPKGHESDAELLVSAASASVRARAHFDPGLSAATT